jgi:hypothetical protein
VGIPKAGMQLAAKGIRAAVGEGEGILSRGAETIAKGYDAAGGGVATTVRNLAKEAAQRTASGASKATVAKALAMRVSGNALGLATIDTLIKQTAHGLGMAREGQTWKGFAVALILGALTSGHGRTLREFSPEEVGGALEKYRWAVIENRPVESALSVREMEVADAALAEMKRIAAGGHTTPHATNATATDVPQRNIKTQRLIPAGVRNNDSALKQTEAVAADVPRESTAPVRAIRERLSPQARALKRRLAPNAEFTENGAYYKADAAGRVVETRSVLKLQKAPRSGYNQRTVGRNDGRLPTDVGGHLRGAQFDGSPRLFNHVPMDAKLNSNDKVLGKWGQMETTLAQALRSNPPKKVELEIHLVYTDGTRRPSAFKVKVLIDGKAHRYFMRNQPGG